MRNDTTHRAGGALRAEWRGMERLLHAWQLISQANRLHFPFPSCCFYFEMLLWVSSRRLSSPDTSTLKKITKEKAGDMGRVFSQLHEASLKTDHAVWQSNRKNQKLSQVLEVFLILQYFFSWQQHPSIPLCFSSGCLSLCWHNETIW